MSWRQLHCTLCLHFESFLQGWNDVRQCQPPLCRQKLRCKPRREKPPTFLSSHHQICTQYWNPSENFTLQVSKNLIYQKSNLPDLFRWWYLANCSFRYTICSISNIAPNRFSAIELQLRGQDICMSRYALMAAHGTMCVMMTKQMAPIKLELGGVGGVGGVRMALKPRTFQLEVCSIAPESQSYTLAELSINKLLWQCRERLKHTFFPRYEGLQDVHRFRPARLL